MQIYLDCRGAVKKSLNVKTLYLSDRLAFFAMSSDLNRLLGIYNCDEITEKKSIDTLIVISEILYQYKMIT